MSQQDNLNPDSNEELNGEKRTDVPLSDENTDIDNVSRETIIERFFAGKKKPSAKRVEQERKKQDELAKVRRKGGITDDDPFDFNNPTLSELYDDFRKNGLSVVESGFNALYLWCNDNYYSSGVPLKNKYKNIYAHPSAWFRNASHMWKHNKWSVAVKLLEIVPAVSAFFSKLGLKRRRAKESFWKTFEYSHHSSGKALGFLLTLMSLAGTAAIIVTWSVHAQSVRQVPALELYIDSAYVGDILAVSEAEAAIDSIEDTLSFNYGMSYKLECDVSYKPTSIPKGTNLTPTKLSLAFSDAAHKHMSAGYGLYAYDVLIAVAEDRTWIENSIEESLDRRLSAEQRKNENIEKVSYHNFIIREGSYPDEFFDSHDDIRYLFSLPPLSEAGEVHEEGAQQEPSAEISDFVSVSDKATLLTGADSATSSDVSENPSDTSHQISIETVVTKAETVAEVIPFDTVYVYDEELAENKQYVKSKGRNGSKTSVYLIDYVGDSEISRHLLNEVIISEAVPQTVIKGTRPLTEEELRVKSTGTYILPSRGEHSSGYGWRTFGGYHEFHKGLDIRSNAGLELVASDGGKVIQARNRGDGYGLCILIEHDDGTITRYAHCSKLLVKEGQSVAQGEHIAEMGRTGQASGVHIHFEIIKNGITVNPMDYLILDS